MIIEQIRSRWQNGFQPFTLELSGGKRIRVPREDFIAVHSNDIVVIDEKGISHTISPLHVVSIDETARH